MSNQFCDEYIFRLLYNQYAWITAISIFISLASLYYRKWFGYHVNHLMLFGNHVLAVVVAITAALLGLVFQLPVDLMARTFACIVSSYRKLVGLTIELRHEYNFTDTDKSSAILLFNHQHMLDSVVQSYLFHKFSSGYTSLVKKKSFPIWPFNAIARRIGGAVLINNDGSITDEIRDDIKNMIAKAKKQKWKIVFYPEGTRNECGNILPFKKGAFRMAIEHRIPILPAVISPYYFIDREKKIFDKGKIIVDFLSPISTEDLTPADMDRLIKEVHDKMSKKYVELRKEVLSS